MRDIRLERDVEKAGDTLMISMGFDVIRFSQARATQQTPGIPDRLYIGRGLSVWWEAKRGGALVLGVARAAMHKQTPHQKVFQQLVQSAGYEYVLGTEEALIDWAVSKGLCTRMGQTIRITRAV